MCHLRAALQFPFDFVTESYHYLDQIKDLDTIW